MTISLSTAIFAAPDGDIRFLGQRFKVENGDIASEVREVKQLPGKRIAILGSASIVVQLAAGKLRVVRVLRRDNDHVSVPPCSRYEQHHLHIACR